MRKYERPREASASRGRSTSPTSPHPLITALWQRLSHLRHDIRIHGHRRDAARDVGGVELVGGVGVRCGGTRSSATASMSRPTPGTPASMSGPMSRLAPPASTESAPTRREERRRLPSASPCAESLAAEARCPRGVKTPLSDSSAKTCFAQLRRVRVAIAVAAAPPFSSFVHSDDADRALGREPELLHQPQRLPRRRRSRRRRPSRPARRPTSRCGRRSRRLRRAARARDSAMTLRDGASGSSVCVHRQRHRDPLAAILHAVQHLRVLDGDRGGGNASRDASVVVAAAMPPVCGVLDATITTRRDREAASRRRRCFAAAMRRRRPVDARSAP